VPLALNPSDQPTNRGLFPGAAQHVFVVRCRPGIVPPSETGTIPGLHCTAPQELRAAARPGKAAGLGHWPVSHLWSMV